ncbi:MAG: hypothetical protein WCH99_11285 [Verrucomicrobiota bacterium]
MLKRDEVTDPLGLAYSGTSDESTKYAPANYKPHYFRLDIAYRFGINDAIVYERLLYLCKAASMTDKSTTLTLTEMEVAWPYLGKSEIYAAVARLSHPAKGVFIKKRAAKRNICRYSVRPDHTPEEDPKRYRFCTNIAAKHGVVAAIIFQNMAFRITDNWTEAFEAAVKEVGSEYHPADVYPVAMRETRNRAQKIIMISDWVNIAALIPKRTAYRAFALLQKEGLLVRSGDYHMTPVWTLPASELDRYALNYLQKNRLQRVTDNVTQESGAKFRSAVPNSEVLCQIQTSCAKFKRAVPNSVYVFSASDDLSTSSETPLKAQLGKAHLDKAAGSIKQHSRAFNESHVASLADARSADETALGGVLSLGTSDIPEEEKAHIETLVKSVTRTRNPDPEKRKAVDTGIKRKYVRKPDINRDDYLDQLEELPVAEREAYIAQETEKCRQAAELSGGKVVMNTKSPDDLDAEQTCQPEDATPEKPVAAPHKKTPRYLAAIDAEAALDSNQARELSEGC